MTVYQDVRVELPESEWRTCEECGGSGRVPDYDDSPSGGHFVRCEAPGCVRGTVKFRYGRTSQIAALAAQNAARRR